MTKINISVTSDDLIPFTAYEDAAGMDLKIDRNLVLQPGDTVKVGTGVRIEVPKGYAAIVLPRSSCKGFRLANTIGLIDNDYRGEIFAVLVSTSSEPIQFFRGDRFLQLMVVPVLPPKFNLVSIEEMSSTARGENGGGSSGVR